MYFRTKTMDATKVSKPRVPPRRFLGRMHRYCAVMFPIHQRIAVAALMYVAFSIVVCRVHHVEIALWSPLTLLGIGNLLMLALILRLMDELKDRDIDARLFADRPLPSGLVLEADIKLSLVVVSTVYLTVNWCNIRSLPLALACFGYTWLMFVYFFSRQLHRRYLLVSLLTHNPSAALFLILTASVIAAQYGLTGSKIDRGHTAVAIIMFWLPVLAWEISRKIRARDDENEYVTYSQIFGRIPAALIVCVIQGVSFVLGAYLARSGYISGVFPAITAAGYSLSLFASTRFIVAPSIRTSKLRPFAEIYAVSVCLAAVGYYVTVLMGT